MYACLFLPPYPTPVLPQASVYRCLEGGAIELVQAYADEDVSVCEGGGRLKYGIFVPHYDIPSRSLPQPSEEFYVCKWSVDPKTGSPLLLLAGHKGVIRVVDCGSATLVHVGVKGHMWV